MAPEEARDKLVEALTIVRQQSLQAQDDWQASLLHTFMKYLQAIGIDRELTQPVFQMYLQEWERVTKLRQREEKGRSPRSQPPAKALAMNAAAACVTALHDRGDAFSVDKATDMVAGASGLDKSEIKRWRDALNRGTYPDYIARSYKDLLVLVRGWPTADMLKSIHTLSGFVS